MGWKNVKEHYRIKHRVCVSKSKGICIGSPYIHDIIVIDFDGKIKKRYEDGPGCNNHLHRYMEEMDADPDKLRELVTSDDTFQRAITVYTYRDGEIVEQKCEVYEWLELTHCGETMYENTHSIKIEDAVRFGKEDSAHGVKAFERIVRREIQGLNETIGHMNECKEHLEKLESDYPDVAYEIDEELYNY